MKRSKKWRTARVPRRLARERWDAAIRETVNELLHAGIAIQTRPGPLHWLSRGSSLTPASADDSITGAGRVVLPEKAIEDENANDRPL